MAASTCRRIPCKISELRLDKTLVCGQSFRWKERAPGIWTGVLAGYVWNLWQTDNELFYQVIPTPGYNDVTSDNCSNTRIKTEHVEVTGNTENDKKAKLVKQDRNKESTKRTIRTPKIKTEQIVTPKIKTTIRTPKIKTEQIVTPKIKTEPTAVDCNHIKLEPDLIDASDELEAILRDYFRLDVNLTDLYKSWSSADPVFRQTARDFMGVRILRQDPVENLFSFICSSNNHISRISGMVERLCQTYGTKITEYEDESYFSFPSVESLSGNDVEAKLRGLGFGYRAKYINVTAKYIQERHSEEWLRGLRDQSYQDTKTELMKLCGVGAKVADCVCLMSMDKLEAVPVDTHVWQIAARDYMPKLKQAKSLTDKLYKEIGDHFRELWGDQAGWAHSVLFAADLKQFKDKDNIKKEVAIKIEDMNSKNKGHKLKRSKTSDKNGGGKKAKPSS
ncbi:LOW QUALITY PROTEIN: N-glycosylase/DNA lyase-like [Argopecten irradians]|uniref:LOW QUALITY PROTEIN: N-glycosylase/DNA lyase-like n=1 Tax=Argopecten irradians TaxID=31199 RepID=UPI003717FEDB